MVTVLNTDLLSSTTTGQKSPAEVSLSGSSPTSTLCESPLNFAVLTYPTPLPKFSPILENALEHGPKSKIISGYSEIIKECVVFYSSLCSNESAKAKITNENIGRTLTEKYPLLSSSDGHKPWSFFNLKLSEAMRNSRGRIKKKLDGQVTPTSSKQRKTLLQAVLVQPSIHKIELNEVDYDEHVNEIKREMSKTVPSAHHLTELVKVTFHKRREWINGTSSHDLRTGLIINKFPCFRRLDMAEEELKLLGLKVLEFKGKFNLLTLEIIVLNAKNYLV